VVQFAVSETQKFGHVTYFWHGNNSGTYVNRAGEIVRTQEPGDGDEILETQVNIPSDVIDSFARAPEMKAAEVARATVEAIQEGRYGFIRVNFANGDMVGHTGDLEATMTAVEAVDRGLGEILSAVDAAAGTLIVTADHGNAEQMVKWDGENRRIKEKDGKPVVLVSHTLNPVPFLIHGPETDRYSLNLHTERLGLGNVAATILNLLGLEAPADYLPPIIRVK
jgi:2,3-bisphosphoglycerate-independent phosphoglycerate mutase